MSHFLDRLLWEIFEENSWIFKNALVFGRSIFERPLYVTNIDVTIWLLVVFSSAGPSTFSLALISKENSLYLDKLLRIVFWMNGIESVRLVQNIGL